MEIFAIVLMIATATGTICSLVYNSRDHIKYEKKDLKYDAQIVDFNVKPVGLKPSRRFRTTVTFDDGFKYISHMCDIEDNLTSYKILLTAAMKEKIYKKAVKAHEIALGNPVPEEEDDYENSEIMEAPEGYWRCMGCGMFVPLYKDRCKCGYKR